MFGAGSTTSMASADDEGVFCNGSAFELLLPTPLKAPSCQSRVLDFSCSDSKSPVDRALVGELGTVGEREAGMVGSGALGRRDAALCPWERVLIDDTDDEAVGVTVRDVSHGGGDINNTGDAGLR